MPSSNSVQPESDWGRQLEQERLKNLVHQKNIGAPVKTVDSVTDFGSAESIDNSRNWAQELERKRMKFALNSGMALPGPGAAAGTASKSASSGGTGLPASINPQQMMQQHGFLGGLIKLFGAMSEQATKPVLKQLIAWHWGLLPTIKGTLISLLLSGPALNAWLFYAHIWRKPGLCKFDPFDLLAVLVYDLIVLLLVGVILVAIVLLSVTAICFATPSECPSFVVEAASGVINF